MSDIEQRIRARAYQLWEQAGRPEAHSETYWFAAQREIEGELPIGDRPAGAIDAPGEPAPEPEPEPEAAAATAAPAPPPAAPKMRAAAAVATSAARKAAPPEEDPDKPSAAKPRGRSTKR